MTISLPPHPSLENLKKQAKTLLKSWQAGNPDTLARVRAAHPRYTTASDDQLRSVRPRVADCQLVLAREAGFSSWPQLKVAIETSNRELSEQFISMACLCYGDPHYDHRSFHQRAHELLRQNPSLDEASIWTAAAAGNANAVARFLNQNPSLVNCPGPYGWPPLICACYSRITPLDPARSTFEAAKILLDRGADPKTFTIRNYYKPLRFTALTGVFGGGDTGLANQPPHPRWRELAELLLQRGADPADTQSLAINQGASLEMLLRYGLTPDAETSTDSGPMTLMGRELAQAARTGHADRVRLLLAHKARMDETLRGKTAWQLAMEGGHLEIARLLEEAGAPTAALSEIDRFVSLCLAGDADSARALLARNPELLGLAPKYLVNRAANTRRPEAITLALDLGFDPNWIDEVTALHNVAGQGNEALARLLLSRGASLKVREPFYDGTAIGWADFFDQRAMRDMLLDQDGVCLFDALDYDRLDRITEILARDPAALERPFAKCLSREPRPEDWQAPLVRMIDRGKTDAVRALLEHGADVTARYPDGRSLLQLARDKGLTEIAALLESR